MANMTDRNDSANAASWAFLLFMTVCLAILEWSAPVPFTLRGMVPLTVACTTLGLVAHFYRVVRPNRNFAEMCVSLSQVLLFSALGVALSYLVARNNYPLWDETLARWDRSLGFDWIAAMRLVDQSPLLTRILSIAYGSLIPQVVVLVCALGFTGRLAALRTIMLAAMVCGTVSIFISAFMPAVAYGVYLGIQPDDFQHVAPWAGFIKMDDFNALRNGTIAHLDFVTMQGIITFPSYHAGLSAVTLWGFWATDKRWLQVPGIAMAIMTIVSTPIDGGHYLVDVLAGLAVAAASVAVARRAIRWSPALPRLTAWPFRHSHAASAR